MNNAQGRNGGFCGTLVIAMVFAGVVGHAAMNDQRSGVVGLGEALPQFEADTRIAVKKLSLAIDYIERLQ